MNLHYWYKFTDKGYAHNTLGVYELLLAGVNVRDILEIGVLNGDSIRMWASEFPEAKVVGIDVEDTTSIEQEFSNVKIHHTDAYTLDTVNQLRSDFDFIVEDGSHILKHQCFVAAEYPTLLRPGGVLVIEDISSIKDAHVIQSFLPEDVIWASYIIDRRGAPCEHPYARFDERNEILVVLDLRMRR